MHSGCNGQAKGGFCRWMQERKGRKAASADGCRKEKAERQPLQVNAGQIGVYGIKRHYNRTILSGGFPLAPLRSENQNHRHSHFHPLALPCGQSPGLFAGGGLFNDFRPVVTGAGQICATGNEGDLHPLADYGCFQSFFNSRKNGGLLLGFYDHGSGHSYRCDDGDSLDFSDYRILGDDADDDAIQTDRRAGIPAGTDEEDRCARA